MKKFILVFGTAGLLMSCGGQDSSENENGSEDTMSNPVVEESLPEIDITLNKLDEVPTECKFEANLVDAYRWVDENGTNYFIRTISEIEMAYPVEDGDVSDSQYLYAYHYVKNSKGEFSLLKETTDFVKDCEFDIKVSHELDAISLTDIDENNIAEISFIYRTTCTSDVSPSTQKLIMLENGKKYPLRGTTKVMEVGGEFEVGEEFNSAPEGFQAHAEKMWSEHLVEYDFEL
ncbi:MAG: hypothetical protein ABJG68_12450 [Crocinitomicaceae bacterium]